MTDTLKLTNKNICIICFTSISILIMAGATAPAATYACLLVSFVPALLLGYKAKDERSVIANGILYLLCVQNLCIGAGAHATGNTDGSLKFLTQIPFMTIFIIWIFLMINRYQNKGIRELIRDNSDKLFLLLILSIAVSFAFGHGSLSAILVSVRNMTVFYMAYCIGRRCMRFEDEFDFFLGFFLVLSMVMCIIGFILMAGGYDLYRLLGVHEVYIAKAAPFAQGRLDDRFIRTVLGRGIIRMGSIYYEPVNLAYFFALAFLCSLFKNPLRQTYLRYLSVCLSLAGLVFTLGKGGYIIVLMAIFCLLGAYTIRRLFRIPYDKCPDNRLLLTMILVSFIGVAAVVVLFIVFNHDRELIMPHIRGITGAARSIAARPWGYGTGTGGNAAMTFNGNITSRSDWYAIGGETALMSFMYQLGIQGVIVFILCMISTGYRKIRKMTSFEKIVFCFPWILICVSLLQDNTFTPQCIVPYMLVIGSISNGFLTRNSDNG